MTTQASTGQFAETSQIMDWSSHGRHQANNSCQDTLTIKQ